MRLHITAALACIILSASNPRAQSRPNSSSTAPGGRFVAIGCVSKQGTGASARYFITDRRGDAPTVYRLQGNAQELERQVGHTVEASGSLTPPAAGSRQYTLKVNSMTWIASGCAK